MKNDQNKTWKVYTHTAPNGDVYVGVTCRDVKLRWQPSLYKGMSLYPYIEQYGWENIKHEVIYTCEDKKEALNKEDELIQYYSELGICINQQRSGLVAKDINAYMHQYYQNNPAYREKRTECSRQWREENPDYMRQWYIEHKEEENERKRQYRQDHKDDPHFREKEKERHRQYRAKKKELNRMAEADLKRIYSDYTISNCIGSPVYPFLKPVYIIFLSLFFIYVVC